MSLTWNASTDNVGVTGYDIYRNGKRVGTATGTSFADYNLSSDTSYSYTVRAFDAGGNHSGLSDSSTGKTQPQQSPPPTPTPTPTVGPAPSASDTPPPAVLSVSLDHTKGADCTAAVSATVTTTGPMKVSLDYIINGNENLQSVSVDDSDTATVTLDGEVDFTADINAKITVSPSDKSDEKTWTDSCVPPPPPTADPTPSDPVDSPSSDTSTPDTGTDN
jgi:hypothetical protein